MDPLDDLDHGLTLRGLRAGMKVFGRYRLKGELGRGGMGVVWSAEDERLDLAVALKFLPEALAHDETAVDDLRRETQRCMKLSHTHIVKVYDLVEEGGAAAIVMEQVKGKTLAKLRLEKAARVFEVGEIKGWVGQVCEALGYAHEEGRMVHRDMKPSNVMVTERGQVKVMDFGIASSLGDSMSRVSKVVAGGQGTGGGTLPYMSPQQLLGYPASVGDDVYGLGAMIYELLTGKPPFYSGSMERQIESVVPVRMSQRRAELKVEGGEVIPETWERVVGACLEKEAEKRPRSVREAWEGLSGVQVMESVSGKRATTDPSAGAGSEGKVSAAAEKMPRLPPAPSWKRRLMKQLGIWVVVGLTPLVAVFVVDRFSPPENEIRSRAQLAANAEQRIRNEAEVVERLVEGGDWNEGRVGEVRQVKLPGGVVLNFGYCPAGSFMMGSPVDEEDRREDENQVQVKISEGFWMGIYEVTQRQWEAVMGSNPSQFKGEDLPVETVSWENAQAFIGKLNQGGGLPEGWKYALPSEAQWEYACRAGTDSVFGFGDSLSSGQANFNGYSSYGGASEGAHLGATSAVGSYKADGWGLHDMHGNVCEWCADWYGEKLEGGTDPVGASSGSNRVNRGGSWFDNGRDCRSADRDWDDPGYRIIDLGIRLAVVPAGAR
jgi:serine/threonine protein kinase